MRSCESALFTPKCSQVLVMSISLYSSRKWLLPWLSLNQTPSKGLSFKNFGILERARDLEVSPQGGTRCQICPLATTPILITVLACPFLLSLKRKENAHKCVSGSTLAPKINVGLTVGMRKQGRFYPAFNLFCLLKAVCSQLKLGSIFRQWALKMSAKSPPQAHWGA